jgi:hypothetical protein
MKKILLVFLVANLYLSATAQSKVNENRRTLGVARFEEYNPTTRAKKVDGAGAVVTKEADIHAKFTIMDEKTMSGYYIVYFWNWPVSTKANSKYLTLNYESDAVTR